MNFLNLKTEAFGIDISDLSLKFAKLKKKRGGLNLTSFGEIEIAAGIIEEGEVKKEEELAKIIREAVSKAKGKKIKTPYVIASLPEEKAFLQVIQLPVMENEELKSAVRFEAENYVPLPLEDVYLDFETVPPLYGKLDHLDVLIAAQPKKIVEGYVASLKKAGLSPKVLEIESQAIARALIKNQTSPFPILIIDIGATNTSLIVFSGHSLRFTTSVPVSSQNFTEAISKALKLNTTEAEKIKTKYGVGAKEEKNESGAVAAKEKDPKERAMAAAVFEASAALLDDFANQIKKYLSYYQSHASHEHLKSVDNGIAKIFLCGGGANIKGLADFLSRELKIMVETGNPWINILPRELKELPELTYQTSLKYTTALGLALRGIREG